MKRAFLLIALAITAGFAVEAGGFGGPMVMLTLPDMDSLNAELNEFNTREYDGSNGPAFSAPLIWLGGQGSAMIEGVSIGGWGAGFFQEATGDSSKAVIGYGMGHGEFGYRFNFFDFLWVKPAVEIGGGGLGLYIGRFRASQGFGEPSDGNEDFFDDQENYSVGQGFVNIGASLDVTVVFPMNPNKTAFSGINVKGGYLYPVYQSDWWDETGTAISKEAVPFNPGGMFASIGVVFGGKGDTESWNDDEDVWEEW